MASSDYKSTFKKMVTTSGRYTTGNKPGKYDFGFAETIRWISTKWSHPTHSWDDNREDIIVRMKDGEVKKLCYGFGRKMAAEYATSEDRHGVVRIEFSQDPSKQLTTIDEIQEFANSYWWYEEAYEDQFSYGEYDGTDHVYIINEEPEYYLEYQIGDIPKDDDFEEEYWEYEDDEYVLKSEPCPYDYEGKEVTNEPHEART